MSRIDVAKTLQAIANHFERQQSHTDGDRLHVTKEELRLAKGRISNDADAVIDAILTDDNYSSVAESGTEGRLLRNRQYFLGPLALSLEGIRAPSSSACSTLRNQLVAPTGTAPQVYEQTKRQIAQSLVRVVGSATRDDANVVVRKLVALFPIEILVTLKNDGYHIFVCRESVTDYRTDLKGVRPRGWPPGTGYESLPGLHNRLRKEILIATRNQGGRRAIPDHYAGHGCFSLLLHEALHAYHSITDGHKRADFLEARKADRNTLDSTCRQEGDKGAKETFAEYLGRFLGGDESFKTNQPHLAAYFKEHFKPEGRADE